MNHVANPVARHHLHALRAGKIDEAQALGAFACAVVATGEGAVGRVEQRETGDAVGDEANDFERDTSAHRMTGDGETRGRSAENGLGHLLDRVARAIVGDLNRGDFGEVTRLVTPDFFVAGKPGQEQDVLQRHSVPDQGRRATRTLESILVRMKPST